MLGPLGPPHVSDQVVALAERGIDMHVGGNALPELKNSVIQDAGIPVYDAPAGSRTSPLVMARMIAWIRSLMHRIEPDVVHAQWLPSFGFSSVVARAKPLVVTAWGSDVYRASRAMQLANRVAVRGAQVVTADSRDLLQRCEQIGPATRSEVIQWGVDLKLFTPAEDRLELKRELGLGEGPLILSPRSLMPVYNIPTILHSFGIVGERIPDAQLVVKHMGSVQIEMPDPPHPERVRMIGSVPYERMADYYRAADVCISLTSSDSSPRSVWEAMACGCPCVISDLPWVRELIEPGVHAVTSPIDAEQAADAIVGLLDDRPRAQEMARAGRALVAQHLSRESQIDLLAGIYDGLA